ncbi:MAG: PIN domain-containing protein [Lachnospiraceae bacterium]|nr:PIN domain-containing protein [Lachnospiraceae bacterium]
MKLLIDTNIILDAMMNREPWAKAAQNIILAVAENKAEACITASSFTDIHYILQKKLRDREKTKQALLGLLAVINVLDVTGTDCEKAFDLPITDYEDALIAYCGKRHKVNYIVTRNLKDYTGSPVEAIAPEEIIKRLEI